MEYEEPTIVSLGRAIIRQIYGMRADERNYDYMLRPSITPNGIWPNSYANTTRESMNTAWLLKQNEQLTHSKPASTPELVQAQTQKIVGRNAPIAQPLPKQFGTDLQLPIGEDPKQQEIQYGPMALSQAISTAASRNNKFRNVPYKRYVPTPSEYRRFGNSASKQAALQSLPVAPYVALNVSRTASYFPSISETSYIPDFKQFGQTITTSPQVDDNLLAQFYKHELHQQQQQQQLQQFRIPAQLPQQSDIGIVVNSKSISSDQGFNSSLIFILINLLTPSNVNFTQMWWKTLSGE